jgi:hypothetical protein
LSSASGCIEELLPGEFGAFRYVDNYRGVTPTLGLLPPLSDRDGNAYVLWSGFESDVWDVTLRVGHAGGGWTASCSVEPGALVTTTSFGVHGFVGRAQGRAWFWAGEWLMGATGAHGGCFKVLRKDVSSASSLAFLAVVPWVRETPSRTTALAWIASSADGYGENLRPFQVVVDLNTRQYTTFEKFEPDGATSIEVLGVGGNEQEWEGVVLVRYTLGGTVRAEARFIDRDGATIDEVSIGGLDTLPAYGVVGYLQANAAGLYAGLDAEGQLIVLDRSGGERKGIGGMTPIGLHRWEGELYLVGEANGKPKIAHIDDDGDMGKVRTWDASQEAAAALDGKIEIIDDRILPSTLTTWKSPRTAIGFVVRRGYRPTNVGP